MLLRIFYMKLKNKLYRFMNINNSMKNKSDQVKIDYKFQDWPNIGGDSVLIENDLTVKDFKNHIQERYHFNVTEYLFIYDSKQRTDMDVLSSFLSKDEEKEVILCKKYTSGFSNLVKSNHKYIYLLY